MATKDELVTFGQANGVDVDSSMLKADVEAALSEAGYDPSTVGEDNVAEERNTPEEEAALSRQSHFSTYSENTDLPETNPPTGRHVIEERGVPAEGEVSPAIGEDR